MDNREILFIIRMRNEARQAIQQFGADLRAMTRATGEVATADDKAAQSKARLIEQMKRQAETHGMTKSQLMEYKAAQAGVTAEVQDAINKVKEHEAAMHKFSLANAGTVRELSVLGREGITHNINRMMGSLIVLARQPGVLAAVFNPLTLTFAGLTVAILGAAAAAEAYNERMEHMRDISAGVGRVALVHADQLKAVADASAQAGNVSKAAAEKMATGYVQMGHIGTEITGDLITVTEKYAIATGSKATEAQKALGKAFEDPTRGAQELQSKLGILNSTQIEEIKHLQESGDLLGAQRVLFDALNKSLEGSNDQLRGMAGLLHDMGKWWDGLTDKIAKFGAGELAKGLDDQITYLKKVKAEMDREGTNPSGSAQLQKQITSLENQKKKEADPSAHNNPIEAQSYEYLKSIGVNGNEMDLADLKSKLDLVTHGAQIAKDGNLASAAAQAEGVKRLTDTYNRMVAINNEYKTREAREHAIQQLEAQRAAMRDGADRRRIAMRLEYLKSYGTPMSDSEEKLREKDAGDIASGHAKRYDDRQANKREAEVNKAAEGLKGLASAYAPYLEAKTKDALLSEKLKELMDPKKTDPSVLADALKRANLDQGTFDQLKFLIGAGLETGKVKEFFKAYMDGWDGLSSQTQRQAELNATDTLLMNARTKAYQEGGAALTAYNALLSQLGVTDAQVQRGDAMNKLGIMGGDVNPSNIEGFLKQNYADFDDVKTKIEEAKRKRTTSGISAMLGSDDPQIKGMLSQFAGSMGIDGDQLRQMLSQGVQNAQSGYDVAGQEKAIKSIAGTYGLKGAGKNDATADALSKLQQGTKAYNDALKQLNITDAEFQDDLERMRIHLGQEPDLFRQASVAAKDFYTNLQTNGLMVGTIVTKGFQSMEDAIVKFATTGKLNMQSFFQGLYTDLVKFEVQAGEKKLFATLTGQAGQGGILGGIGSFLNGTGGQGAAGAAGTAAQTAAISASTTANTALATASAAATTAISAMASAAAMSAGTSGASGGMSFVSQAMATLSMAHSGAIAGGYSAWSRSVNPSVFDGARRFHTGGLAGLAGLGSGEVPVIAKQGEAILPTTRLPDGNFGVKAMVGGGGGNMVHFAPQINVTVQGGEGQTGEQHGQAVAAQLLPALRQMVDERITSQMRPGGLLNGGNQR